jgi:uncharacterized membrane protein
MFFAYLVILPALAQFVSILETTFFDQLQRYYAAISDHATLTEIRAHRARFERLVMRSLRDIMMQLVVIAAIVLLATPTIVTAAGLQYQQTAIIRVGVIAAVFHFLFAACASMLIFFERYRTYLLLQCLFLGVLATGTAASVVGGPQYYGLGLLAAAMLSAGAAFSALDAAVRDLEFLTFVAGPAQAAARTIQANN